MPDTLTELYQDAIYYDPNTIRTGGAEGTYNEIEYTEDMALSTGTIALTFEMDRSQGEYALISMDSYGNEAGEFTLWIKDGMLQLSMETGSGTEWISVPEVDVTEGEVHHVGLTFGEDGLELWYDGVLVEVETDHTAGIAPNTDSIIVGGSNAWNSNPESEPHSLFQGEIGNVAIFDEQLGEAEMLMMLEGANPDLAAEMQMEAFMADLLPAFSQLHHASDTLEEIAEDYGISHHGHPENMMMMMTAAGDDTPLKGNGEANAMLGSLNNDRMNGGGGSDIMQGSYGNDILIGGGKGDILDGGHGEDILVGGAGNDLLISQADAREPEITYVPGRDEGDPDGELTDGKVYPDQPIPGDDTLFGGAGADIFYFQTLINAKEQFIQEHTKDDGSINWHGVAGENDDLHDHWVDEIGDDVILDYDRDEGDRIVIEGHTTEIQSITYEDTNGDGIMDASIISLYSNQGNNGGAHQYDELGTITVHGDLVTIGDIETTAAPAYGIVASYEDLDEALTPISYGEDMGELTLPMGNSGPPSGYKANSNLIFATSGDTEFVHEDRSVLIFDNQPEMQVANGTIAMNFSVSEFDGSMFLFSKDASGQDDAGHLSAYVQDNGTLQVRFQDEEHSYYYSVEGAIEQGEEYDLAITFGEEGFAVYLNGVRVAYNDEVTHGWEDNSEHFIVGANGWSSTPGTTDHVSGHFNGTISDVVILEGQMTPDQLYQDPSWDDVFTVASDSTDVTVQYGTSGALEIVTSEETLIVPTDANFVEFDDVSVRVRDMFVGTPNDEYHYGDDGADYVDLKDGNDTVYGRENDDRLFGNNGNDKLVGEDGADGLYGGNGNDSLYGGDGQDTLSGDDGNDYLRGDAGQDLLNGGAGNDTLYGGGDDDLIRAGEGHDTVYGEDGSDQIHGSLGDDKIYGQSWGSAGGPDSDEVHFLGDYADYSFEFNTNWNSSRGEDMVTLTVTDHATGGSDGLYEGADQLIDIELLVFADQTVMVDDLLAG